MLLLVVTMMFALTSGDLVGNDSASYVWRVPIAPTIFHVNVGLHIAYDWTYNRSFYSGVQKNERLDDYFTALTKAVEQRFLNGNFAMIRLVYTGSTLSTKFDTLKTHHDVYGIGQEVLDPARTLENIVKYVIETPYAFPHADLILFVTSETMEEDFFLTPLTKTVRGGVCTDAKVGFFYDDAQYFLGTLGMAQEVAILLGASTFENGDPDLLYKPLQAGRCGLSTRNWIQLKTHVMNMRYSVHRPEPCLQDIPIPARPELPFQYLQKVNYCKRIKRRPCGTREGKDAASQIAYIPRLSQDCWTLCCDDLSDEEYSEEEKVEALYVPLPDGSPCFFYSMCIRGFCVTEYGELAEEEKQEPEQKEHCPPPKGALTRILQFTP